MSPPSGEDILFLSCLSIVYKLLLHLNGNSQKLCMLVYYQMKIHISLLHVDPTIFLKNYCRFFTYVSSRSLYSQLLNFKCEILKSLHTCLLPYEDSHIATAVCSDLL